MTRMQSRLVRPLRRKARIWLEQLEARNLLTIFTPAQIAHAYGFDNVTLTGGVKGDGTGQTIAIVDAFHDPTIASDLHTFDVQWGLPDPVFAQAYAQGSQPAQDLGWNLEEALDVEWAHAIAPKANILLVEAADNSGTNLYAADVFAANQSLNGAAVSVVSNSWGGGEYSSEKADDANFVHSGVTFVFSAGDSGAPAEYPSASPNVLSVGGTTLSLDRNGNWSREAVWRHGGGGPSAVESKPAYQNALVSGTKRGTPDVSYDADPNTGVYVYDTNNGGWFQVGGTSAGAPQWAALVAIVDQGLALNGKGSLSGSDLLSAIYKASSSDFHDITFGSNGYSARPGYDFASGRGTPIANKLIPDLVLAPVASSPVRTTTLTTTTTSHRVTTRLTTADNDPSLANAAIGSQTNKPPVQNVQATAFSTTAPTLPALIPVQVTTPTSAIALSGSSDETVDSLDKAEPIVKPASFQDDTRAPVDPAGPVNDSSVVPPMNRDAVDGFFAAPVLVAQEMSATTDANVSKSEASPIVEWNAGVVSFLAFVGGNWAMKSAREEEKRPAMKR